MLIAVARLTGIALRRMSSRVALAALATGVGVASAAFLVPTSRDQALELVPEASAMPAPAPETVVEGSVHLASGRPVTGATVLLHRFEATKEIGTLTAVTAADGGFRFDALPSGPVIAYTVSTDHAGTTFRTPLLLPGAATHRADLVVAETTDDPAAVELAVDSSVFVGDDDGMRVLHIVNVTNTTDRAYTGGVRLPLLPGATGLDPRRGLDRTRLVVDDGELVSMSPLLPGATEIVYDYAVAVPRAGIRLRREIAHPTRTYALLSAGGLEIRASGFRDAGRVRIGGGRSYRQLERRGLTRGDVVEASIAPRQGGGALVRTGVVLGVVMVAIAAVLWPLVRRRPRTTAA